MHDFNLKGDLVFHLKKSTSNRFELALFHIQKNVKINQLDINYMFVDKFVTLDKHATFELEKSQIEKAM